MNKSSIVPKVLVNPPNKSKLSYRLNGQHIKVVWNCFTVSVEHNAEAFLWEAHVSNFMGFLFFFFNFYPGYDSEKQLSILFPFSIIC